MGKENEIRLIAYGIWEEEGCENGHDCEHWIRAKAIWEKKQERGSVSGEPKVELKHNTKLNKKNNFLGRSHIRS
jgi:hypothetical protein